MPIGLHRFEQFFPAAVPYARAVNGLASVVASVLGVAIALFVGFRATTLLAAACYSIALAHATYGPWSTKPLRPGTSNEHNAVDEHSAPLQRGRVETPTRLQP
jgi:hypothetical protein